MISDSRPFLFRLLCLLLICLILVNCLIVPVYASEIILYEILAATARNLLASLIRACGVYVADGIQSDLSDGLAAWEDLVDFVMAKLPSEFLLVNAAGDYFIKMIFKDGLYYADRNLIQAVFNILFNMTSNSEGDPIYPVGYGFTFEDAALGVALNEILSDLEAEGYYYGVYTRRLRRCYVFEFEPTYSYGLYSSPIFIFTNGLVSHTYEDGILTITIAGGSERVHLSRGTNGGTRAYGSYGNSSSSAYTFSIAVNSYDLTKIAGDITVDLDTEYGTDPVDSLVTDSIATGLDSSWTDTEITVTDESSGTTVSALTVSVPSSTSSAATSTQSNVTSGTEVKAETVTDVDSLVDSSTDVEVETETGFWAKLWSWLQKLWQALLDILTAVKSLAISIAQPIVNAIADVVAAVKALAPDPPSFEDFQVPSLQDFFPFCIPFDLLDMMRALSASPVAPSFVFACPLPGGDVYEVNIDLSAWNGVAATIRSVIVAIYVVTLANATRKFIKW